MVIDPFTDGPPLPLGCVLTMMPAEAVILALLHQTRLQPIKFAWAE